MGHFDGGVNILKQKIMCRIYLEISPEYMAQIESEMTQPTYVKPATTIANPTLFKLHHEQGGLEYVDIEEGYYIFPGCEPEDGESYDEGPMIEPIIGDDLDELPF